MKLKSTTLSLSGNSINHAQAKQDKKAPYFMNLVMIKGAWTFILSATLDLLLHTQASFRHMCRDTTADDTIDQEMQKF